MSIARPTIRAAVMALTLLATLATQAADDSRTKSIQAARDYLETLPEHPFNQLIQNPNTQWTATPTIESGDQTWTLSSHEISLLNLGSSVLAGRDRANLLKLYKRLSTSFADVADYPDPEQISALTNRELRNLVAHYMSTIETVITDFTDEILLAELVFNPIGDCTGEVGYEFGGSTAETSAKCALAEYATNGLMSNVSFPLQDNLTCIKSQGSRGTCVAHAVAAAIETANMVNGGFAENLSEQDIYYEAKTQAPGQPDMYLDGLWTDMTLEHLEQSGYQVQYEEAWNYNRSPNRIGPLFMPGPTFLSSCDVPEYLGEMCTDLAFQGTEMSVGGGIVIQQRPSVPTVGAREVTSTVTLPVGAPFNINTTLASIVAFVTADVPVILSVSVTTAFRLPGPDGYVRPILGQPIAGGHALVLVGFVANGDLPAGVTPAFEEGYFIAKNSWGKSSADCGFVYLDWSYLRSYATAFDILEVN